MKYFPDKKTAIRPLEEINHTQVELADTHRLFKVSLNSVPDYIAKKLGFDLAAIAAAAEVAGISSLTVHDRVPDFITQPEETPSLTGSLIKANPTEDGTDYELSLGKKGPLVIASSDLSKNAGFVRSSRANTLGKPPFGMLNPKGFDSIDLEIGFNRNQLLKDVTQRQKEQKRDRNDNASSWAEILDRNIAKGVISEGVSHLARPQLTDAAALFIISTIQTIIISTVGIILSNAGVETDLSSLIALMDMASIGEWHLITKWLAKKIPSTPFNQSALNLFGVQLDRLILLTHILDTRRLVLDLEASEQL